MRRHRTVCRLVSCIFLAMGGLEALAWAWAVLRLQFAPCPVEPRFAVDRAIHALAFGVLAGVCHRPSRVGWWIAVLVLTASVPYFTTGAVMGHASYVSESASYRNSDGWSDSNGQETAWGRVTVAAWVTGTSAFAALVAFTVLVWTFRSRHYWFGNGGLTQEGVSLTARPPGL